MILANPSYFALAIPVIGYTLKIPGLLLSQYPLEFAEKLLETPNLIYEPTWTINGFPIGSMIFFTYNEIVSNIYGCSYK